MVRPEADIRCLHQSLPTLFFETESLILNLELTDSTTLIDPINSLVPTIPHSSPYSLPPSPRTVLELQACTTTPNFFFSF